jgi:hypothetical protein
METSQADFEGLDQVRGLCGSAMTRKKTICEL